MANEVQWSAKQCTTQRVQPRSDHEWVTGTARHRARRIYMHGSIEHACMCTRRFPSTSYYPARNPHQKPTRAPSPFSSAPHITLLYVRGAKQRTNVPGTQPLDSCHNAVLELRMLAWLRWPFTGVDCVYVPKPVLASQCSTAAAALRTAVS